MQDIAVTESTLAELEAVIEHGLQKYIEVGLALLTIRDRKLYREQGHTTFEDYCQKRWGWSRVRAHQMIDGARVAGLLTTVNTAPPETERQARELTPIMRQGPDKVAEVWQEVKQRFGDDVTAADVRTVVQEHIPPKQVPFPTDREILAAADKAEAEGSGLGQKEWDALPESYTGDCYKQCYGPRVMVKGDVLEYGVRGVYKCTGCGYQYAPFCQPAPIQQPPPAPTNVYQPMAVHYSSETPEWYTPKPIIERVQRCLGQIDLDPCSNTGTPNVPALLHYTVQEDGLAHDWRGRVYMNPPYGRVIAGWVAKFWQEYAAGHVAEGIALVPARTDTDWFRLLRDCAVCFIDGRLHFNDSDAGAPFPSCAVYAGPNVKRFAEVFGAIGDVWTRWSG